MLKYSLATALTSLADTQTKQLQPLTKLMLVNCPCASNIQKSCTLGLKLACGAGAKGLPFPSVSNALKTLIKPSRSPPCFFAATRNAVRTCALRPVRALATFPRFLPVELELDVDETASDMVSLFIFACSFQSTHISMCCLRTFSSDAVSPPSTSTK